MSTKRVELPDIGIVNLYKRKGARSLRLSVSAAGEVRVSLPYWLPYEAGVSFVRSKRDWILAQPKTSAPPLTHGQAIGKSHHLYFRTVSGGHVSTRLTDTDIRVAYPESRHSTEPAVQKAAKAASIRALRAQANTLLPQRLRTLAQRHGLSYRSVKIKRMTARWGSCDAEQNIVLNLFLMQLPWHLIDYVLVHELIHTRVPHHGAEFWQEFEKRLPTAKALRREIRGHQPILQPAVGISSLETT